MDGNPRMRRAVLDLEYDVDVAARNSAADRLLAAYAAELRARTFLARWFRRRFNRLCRKAP